MNKPDSINDVIFWRPEYNGEGYGWCDRFRGIAGISLLASGFRLPVVMPWVISDSCPFGLHELMEMPHIICLPDINIAPPQDFNVVLTVDHPLNATVSHMYHYYNAMTDQVLFDFEAEFELLWESSLRSFRPVKAIRRRIKNIWQRDFRPFMVGAHIRRTDKFRGDPQLTQEHDDALTNYLVEQVGADPQKGVYLASDNKQSFEYVETRLKQKGVYVTCGNNDFEKASFRQTSGEDLVTDIHLLGACQQLAATVSSGVMHYAAAVSRLQVNWVGPDHFFDPWFWGGAENRLRDSENQAPVPSASATRINPPGQEGVLD